MKILERGKEEMIKVSKKVGVSPSDDDTDPHEKR